MLAWLLWWAVVSALGWLIWSIVRPLFARAPGLGLAYARAAALVIINYSFWLLGMVGLIPNTTQSLWTIVAAWALLSIVCAAWQAGDLRVWLRRHWRHALAVELLFVTVMALYALHKAYDPAVDHTEEPMDLLLINGILASPRLPPRDPWLSGFPISYYYLGYFSVASLIRLTGVSSGVGYNLGLAHTLALFVIGVYGLLHDLAPKTGRKALLPALGALLVVFVGNLETLLEMLAAWGVGSPRFYPWFSVAGLDGPSQAPSLLPSEPWWWWRASRVIQDANFLGKTPTVITEFPAFSFVLGDLHPHVMALPYVILALGLVPVLYLYGRHAEPRPKVRAILLVPLLLGALGFVNSWDLPTYLGLNIAGYALGRWQRVGESVGRRLLGIGLVGGYLAAASIAFYLPFYRGLQTQAEGLGLAYYAKTSLREYLLCFGGFLLPLLGSLLLTWYPKRRAMAGWPRRVWLVWLGVFLLPWGVTLLLGGWGRTLIALAVMLQAGPWVLLLQSGMLALVAADLWRMLRRPNPEDGSMGVLSKLLVLVGLGLTYVIEFVYLLDVFDTRMNTVFKFTYQAWVLLGLGAVLSLGQLWRAGRGWRVMSVASVALLLACLYYPLAAAYTRADGYRGEPTLDGVAYLQNDAPEAYRLIAWLKEHAQPGDVLVEAPGAEYDASTSRVSALTGIPTILGWPGHEVQWRGDEALVRQRLADLETIYTSEDRDRVLDLLHAYGATYVVLDPYAVARYALSADQLAAWDDLPLRYAEGSYRLYAVPDAQANGL